MIPYDHSRVVLNALANPSGSDYINASTIVKFIFYTVKNWKFVVIFLNADIQTDHDPRHPAYIAAQAPVSESVADFWQMIWEQGIY